MRVKVLFSVLCAVGLCSTLRADQVLLKNGDRLTGKIVSLTGGKLVLKSDLVGEITIEAKNIATFKSDTPVEVHLKDGTVLHQPVTAAEPNQFSISTAEPLKPQTFSLGQVESINPPAKPKPKWTGSISGAVGATTGNTKTNSISGSVNMTRRSEKDRIIGTADFARSSREDPDTGGDETFENWWRATAQYDYFFTKKFFGFGNARYEKDAIADLDRRIVVGGGAGYQWVETDPLAFSTNFGLASLYEKYENIDEGNSTLTLQAGYNLNMQLVKGVRLLHDLTYFPSTEKFSDYFLTTTAEVRASLTKSMFANFKVIFNYDATPAPDRGSTDVKYLLGVGMTF